VAYLICLYRYTPVARRAEKETSFTVMIYDETGATWSDRATG
jgi:hypothetical protein